MWPAWRKESGWSSYQKNLKHIGTRGGQKNYDHDNYDDDDYDDDDGNNDNDDYDVFSSTQMTSNRAGTKGANKIWWW